MKVMDPRWLLPVSLAVLLSACGQGTAQQAPKSAAPMPVGVQALTLQSVTITAKKPARLSPSEVAQVRPQVSGIIQQRLFKEGSVVQAGQPLYQIDSAPFAAKVAQAEAALARAQADLVKQTAKQQRYLRLQQTKAVSQQEFDEVEAALLQAKADVKTAQAQLKTANLDLTYSQVKAPISGIIGKSSVTAGALVAANQQEALATITQLDPIYADFALSSRELAELKGRQQRGELQQSAGQTLVTLVDESQTQHAGGELLFNEVQVDSATGSVTLRAKFANAEGLLLPGAFAEVEFVEGVVPQALLVPQFAVSRNAKGEPTALVVSQEQTVAQRVLKVSRAVQGQWLVQAGFEPGDQLIVAGLQKVRPGMPVQAEQAPLPPANRSQTSSTSVAGAR